MQVDAPSTQAVPGAAAVNSTAPSPSDGAPTGQDGGAPTAAARGSAAQADLDRPLSGVRIVEFEALGPAPLAGMMLADMGAEVTLVTRPGATPAAQFGGPADGVLRRGKRPLEIDLKSAAGAARALELVANSDALIEGFRPGVMERLGLGPAACLARQPQLVYGRMTGWGQTGPLARAAGHDLNYVALTGVLSLSRRGDALPVVPPTVIGDAGGALGLAYGVVCALHATRQGGLGRVVDAAIVDVVALLGTLVHWMRAAGRIDSGTPNFFEGSPFYEVYACADGLGITLAALEPQFYALLLQKLGLDDVDPGGQMDTATWPALKSRLSALFATRPRQAWCDLLEGSDACFAPVLTIDEAARHPHNAARGTFTVADDGEVRARPAPRFIRP
jgi:alpha-methylacyl-CoA racemase